MEGNGGILLNFGCLVLGTHGRGVKGKKCSFSSKFCSSLILGGFEGKEWKIKFKIFQL